MFKIFISTVLVFVVVACALCVSVFAQETKTDQQKAMDAYMKAMAPNENHAFLKSFVGQWDVTSTAWMKPGAPPSVSSSTCTAELILGGRYVMLRYQGVMFGQPFEGIQIIGYDNTQKKYNEFWIDNTSTSFYLTSGTREAAGNTINETGLWPDPMTGGTSKTRAVTKLIGSDEFTYELFMVGPDGKEFKSLDNRSVRKK